MSVPWTRRAWFCAAWKLVAFTRVAERRQGRGRERLLRRSPSRVYSARGGEKRNAAPAGNLPRRIRSKVGADFHKEAPSWQPEMAFGALRSASAA